MSDDRLGAQCRVAEAQRRDELGQAAVLRRFVWIGIGALELNPDREIVAGIAPAPARDPGMPGPLVKGHKLHRLAAAPDQHMRRDPQSLDLLEIRMRLHWQAPAKELLDPRAAK